MKIQLILSSLKGGGAERVACNLAAGWVRRGYSVCVTTLASSDEDFYTLDAGVRRIALNNKRPSENTRQRISMNLKRFFDLRRVMKDENPDVVVALMTSTNVLTLLSAVWLKVPILVCEHSFPPKSTNSKVWKFLRKLTYKMATIVVALTAESGDWLRQHTNAARVVSIPNALAWPLKEQDPRVDPSSLAPGRKRFVSVGRLDALKAFDRLIQSFALIVEKLPEWDLVIVGSGKEEDSLKALVAELRIQDRVKFVGAVGNVSDWYRACDVFVLSSDTEGFPGALLEAMASGLCVVSVDCQTGPKDIITHEKNGILCAVSVDALSEHMLVVACDNELRKRLGESATNVVDTYSEEAILHLWDDQFTSLGLLS